MKYNNTRRGVFVSRPNRFEAIVELDGETVLCHVKNTGRCRELLIQGVEVILSPATNPARKTGYDLVGVYKGKELINIDSSAPNKVIGEWLEKEELFKDVQIIKPESKYKNSRFDFYLEAEKRKIYIEVKGVTLEENGVVMFPDAPTQRGVKHIMELLDALENGYEGYLIFVVQMKNALHFTPNSATHKEFAEALELAQKRGVGIYALACDVSEDEISISHFIPIKI